MVYRPNEGANAEHRRLAALVPLVASELASVLAMRHARRQGALVSVCGATLVGFVMWMRFWNGNPPHWLLGISLLVVVVLGAIVRALVVRRLTPRLRTELLRELESGDPGPSIRRLLDARGHETELDATWFELSARLLVWPFAILVFFVMLGKGPAVASFALQTSLPFALPGQLLAAALALRVSRRWCTHAPGTARTMAATIPFLGGLVTGLLVGVFHGGFEATLASAIVTTTLVTLVWLPTRTTFHGEVEREHERLARFESLLAGPPPEPPLWPRGWPQLEADAEPHEREANERVRSAGR